MNIWEEAKAEMVEAGRKGVPFMSALRAFVSTLDTDSPIRSFAPSQINALRSAHEAGADEGRPTMVYLRAA